MEMDRIGCYLGDPSFNSETGYEQCPRNGVIGYLILVVPCIAMSVVVIITNRFSERTEPFDTASWMLVGVVAIQAATFTIFLFEWLSPSGFDMKQVAPAPNHRFSLFRTYWLVWAVLFQAAVHVDSPRGFTARFMTNVWAMFAVVFLAIYTANLAAFMITREEFHEFSGIDDHRRLSMVPGARLRSSGTVLTVLLAKPFSNKPMYKFGTIPWSHTDSTLNKYFKEMHAYMRTYNRTTVAEGIVSVLNG
uniref:Ionotropic glutamate receptor C-terminal domain-containing protein n=1 Tax=Timema shepardi TaxID=629360 RepID=A0A7R9G6A1_TIMSH|nr:unnamed protein product [Timema shepardi]